MYSKRTSGNDHNDEAAKHVKKHTIPKNPKPNFYTATEGQAKGHYRKTGFVSLSQKTGNTYYSTNALDSAGLIATNYFTPQKFKDAEAVCFNSKAATIGGHTVVTVGAANNFQHNQNTYVAASRVTFNFRNVTQHSCTVEMFICFGKDETTGTAVNPFDDFNAGLDMYLGNIGTATVATPGIPAESVIPFMKIWDTTLVTFKFEPGEKASHVLQGPYKYVMDGMSHVEYGTVSGNPGPAWLTPQVQGNGCVVWFRMINDITVVVGSTGDANGNMANKIMGVAHPINQVTAAGVAQGAVICQIVEDYYMRAPTGVQAQEARSFVNAFPAFTGATVDVQIDADDSGTISGTL